MPSAQEIAEQAIQKLDDEDNKDGAADAAKGDDDAKKTDDPKDADKSDSGASKDASSDNSGGDDDKKAGADKAKDGADDTGADDGGDGADKSVKADEGKFTADDALEIDTKAEETKTDAPRDAAGIQITPDEGKFIADHIGEPLIIRGIQGEGDNAKDVELKVYSPQDIPNNFKFANDRELQLAQAGFGRLENKAQQLLGDFRNQQSAKQAREFEQRENEGIRLDVADLQKEGLFPKFTVKPGEAGFEKDPAAGQMSEVLKLMTERNDMYLKQYQQGRPYRHIGFREAFTEWQSKQTTKTRNDAQAQEDAERKQVADKVATGRGQTGDKTPKPRIQSGTTVSDILNKYDGEEW